MTTFTEKCAPYVLQESAYA